MSVRLGTVLLAGSSSNDNVSITKNSSNKLQSIGVIDQNDTTKSIKTWIGTRAEYDALVSNDDIDYNTVYNITDDDNYTQPILETIYPVGSLYFGTMATCPLAALFGTWTLQGTKILVDINSSAPVLGDGKALGLTDGTTNAGLNTINAGNTGTLIGNPNQYGEDVGHLDGTNSYLTFSKAVGVTTDSTKSGIIADTSSLATNLTVNIWKRTE